MGLLSLIVAPIVLLFDLIVFLLKLPFKILGAIFGGGGKPSCPACGSEQLSKNGDVVVCRNCGTRHQV